MRSPTVLVVLGLALMAGCAEKKRGSNPEQAQAILEIEKAGANVAFDVQSPEKPVLVFFSAGRANDGDLNWLEKLPELQRLNLSDSPITDAGLAHLKGLAQLEELDLSGTKVTDVGLKHLKGLTKLQEVNLSRTKVTAAGVSELQQAAPRAKLIQ